MFSTKYALSNLTMFDSKLFWLAQMPLGVWVKLVRDAGYDGLEWFPLRNLFLSQLQLTSGLVSQKTISRILALHLSYLSEHTLEEALREQKRNPAALASFLMLVHKSESLSQAIYLEDRYYSNRLPVVIYPNQHDELNKFPQRIQLTESLLSDYDLRSADQLINWLNSQNIQLVFDTQHSRNLAKKLRLSNWKEIISITASHITELHVRAAGYLPNVSNQQKELGILEIQDLLKGGIGSELAQILLWFSRTRWHGLVTIEIPFREIAIAANIQSIVTLPQTFVLLHSQLLKNLKKLLEHK